MNNVVFDKTMENVRNHVEKINNKMRRMVRRGDNDRETEFLQPQRLCGKFDRRRNAQTQDEVRQADLCEYVHTRHIESLLVQISSRVYVIDVSRQM